MPAGTWLVTQRLDVYSQAADKNFTATIATSNEGIIYAKSRQTIAAGTDYLEFSRSEIITLTDTTTIYSYFTPTDATFKLNDYGTNLQGCQLYAIQISIMGKE